MTQTLQGLLVLLLVLAPRAAEACSVCSAGRDDETRNAFLATTVLLTLLPLMLVGGMVWWLRRRALALEKGEALDRAGAPPELEARSG